MLNSSVKSGTFRWADHPSRYAYAVLEINNIRQEYTVLLTG